MKGTSPGDWSCNQERKNYMGEVSFCRFVGGLCLADLQIYLGSWGTELDAMEFYPGGISAQAVKSVCPSELSLTGSTALGG